MKLNFTVTGDFKQLMKQEYAAGERAATLAMRQTAGTLKAQWRANIQSAGLGSKLSNAVRSAAYPAGEPSLNAAAMVWSKAPKLTSVHETGAVITSQNGFWLAVPLPAAGKGLKGRKISPGEWEARTGRRLTFIYRRGRTALLIDTGTYADRRASDPLSFKQSAKRGRRNVSIPIFALVPQVRLKKRTTLMQIAQNVAGQVPALIVANWR